jgi:hypothetical protein
MWNNCEPDHAPFLALFRFRYDTQLWLRAPGASRAIRAYDQVG